MSGPDVVSDSEVIRQLLANRERFVFYLGAGASAEADVPTGAKICKDVRDRIISGYGPDAASDDEVTKRIEERLAWHDAGIRYASCVRAIGGPAARVEYFRDLLRGKRPTFAHHAIALLTQHRVINRTCVTTNFDKLLETAYAVQGRVECQPVRTDDEIRYLHSDPEKAYLLKLHGDYDTNNIMNTEDETVRISTVFQEQLARVVTGAGLVVLGTAGWEKSVNSLFDELERLASGTSRLLEFGLFWGVFMHSVRPPPESMVDPLATDTVEAVWKQIRTSINPGIGQMMRRLANKGIPAAFFPFWGCGAFLNAIMQRHEERSLKGTAQIYLDHEMRLRDRFEKAQVSEAGIKNILAKLRQRKEQSAQRTRGEDLYHDECLSATRGDQTLRLVYGDIARRSELGRPGFMERHQAVVSPEDTWLSAGGGVAYSLVQKAGERYMLNELTKCYPIDHCDVAVTSGGDLPVNFVFHAATVKIDQHGDYQVNAADITRTSQRILEIAEMLRVQVIWLPLLGSGAGDIGPADSLSAILEAVQAYGGVLPTMMTIVVRSTRTLSRRDALDIAKDMLGAQWTVTVAV